MNVMPLGLQKYTLLRTFNRLNPDAEPDNLDWDYLDDKCSFEENRENMAHGNTDYIWYDPLDECDIGQMEVDRQIQEKLETLRILQNDGLDEEAEKVSKEIDEIEASFKKKFYPGWHVDKTEDGETHTIEVEIKPITQVTDGKKYTYGEIQLRVGSTWVGLKAKISVFKPSERQRKRCFFK